MQNPLSSNSQAEPSVIFYLFFMIDWLSLDLLSKLALFFNLILVLLDPRVILSL